MSLLLCSRVLKPPRYDNIELIAGNSAARPPHARHQQPARPAKPGGGEFKILALNAAIIIFVGYREQIILKGKLYLCE